MDNLSAWLLEARAGNVDSFEKFVRHMQSEIWNFSRRIVGDAEADEVAQEIFIAAWRSLSLYRAEASARTWLYVIANRKAQECARRRARHSRIPLSAHEPALPDAGQRLELADLIRHLSPERRIALVLTQVLGFSYAEAAQVCECPVGTIRSRVARARMDLLTEVAPDSPAALRLGFA